LSLKSPPEITSNTYLPEFAQQFAMGDWVKCFPEIQVKNVNWLVGMFIVLFIVFNRSYWVVDLLGRKSNWCEEKSQIGMALFCYIANLVPKTLDAIYNRVIGW